jgi:hypothetical protein
MLTRDDVKGTHMDDPKVLRQCSQMAADATPEFYKENLRRLRGNGVNVYFALPHLRALETVERLIPQGLYMGAV